MAKVLQTKRRNVRPTVLPEINGAEARAVENDTAKNKYHATVIRRNPGNNLKGKTTQVKNYHTGKRSDAFIEDPKARAKSLYSRKQTILKKIRELDTATGCEVFFELRAPAQKPMQYKSTFYEKYELQTIGNNEDEKEIDKSAETSAPTIAYNSPVKRRATTTVQTLVNEHTQTRRVDDNEEGESGADKCRKCGIVHESEEDIASDSKWMGCDFKIQKGKDKWEDCNYWVHEKCVGIYVKGGSKKGKCARRFSVAYLCPDHRQ